MPEDEKSATSIDKATQKISGWRTILMIAASAVLGGTAVALWNRHALTEIQEHSPARVRKPLRVEVDQPGESDDAAQGLI